MFSVLILSAFAFCASNRCFILQCDVTTEPPAGACSSTLCMNNGNCTNVGSSFYLCLCSPAFTGQQCETSLFLNAVFQFLLSRLQQNIRGETTDAEDKIVDDESRLA